MRILMLGWELPPLNSGGLGVACYHLCRHIANLGAEIDFVMPYPLPSEHHVNFMRVYYSEHHTAPFVGGYAAQSAEMRLQRSHYRQVVQQLLEQNDYDAIHAHDWLTLEAGIYAKQQTGKPLIAHVHSTEFDRCGNAESGNPIAHEIEYTCLLMADKIIAVSEATKKVLVERYQLPANKIDVIYNAADLSALQVSGANAYTYLEAMKRQGYTVAVSIGRLTVQKGFPFLLEAAQRAIRLHPKLLFVIVGDGEQKGELVARSAELGIANNVIFTGFLRGKAWRDTYHIADMFIMSSVSEPFGLTALEAAGSNNAIIISHQSGASEVLRSTLKYNYWDTERLADDIINVAEHASLRASLAAQAGYEVQSLSWPRVAEQVFATYHALAGAAV